MPHSVADLLVLADSTEYSQGVTVQAEFNVFINRGTRENAPAFVGHSLDKAPLRPDPSFSLFSIPLHHKLSSAASDANRYRGGRRKLWYEQEEESVRVQVHRPTGQDRRRLKGIQELAGGTQKRYEPSETIDSENHGQHRDEEMG